MERPRDWFGLRLKEARERAGLTQEQLAERATVGVQAVKDWETGRKHPMLERVPRLAEILGVDPGCFFPREAPRDRVQEGPPSRSLLEARLDSIEVQLRLLRHDLRSLVE